MQYIVVFAYFCAFPLLFAQSQISGTLLGYDGKPMKMAHVHLLSDSGLSTLNPKTLKTVQVQSDGSFVFPMPASANAVAHLEFTGVDHAQFRTNVYLENQDTIQLRVQLVPYPYKDELSQVQILTAETNYAIGAAKPFTQLSDGTLVAEFEAKADTFAYQLSELHADGRSINGTQNDYFVYDGDGDYRSVIRTKKGQHFAISLDPRKLVRSEAVAQINVVQPQSKSAKITDAFFFGKEMRADFERKNQSITQTFTRKMLANMKKGTARPDTAISRKHSRDLLALQMNYDWKPYYAEMEQRIEQENDAMLKAVLLIGHIGLSGRQKNKLDYVPILNTFSPDAPVWALFPMQVGLVKIVTEKQAKEQAETYFARFIAENPNKEARLWLLNLNLMPLHMKRDTTAIKIVIEQMKAIDPASKLIESAEIFLAMSKGQTPKMTPPPISRSEWKNKPFPAFSFPSFDDPSKQVNSEMMRGKYVLIDFWAVWCAPCIGEMPKLHEVYQKFKDRNIVFVSISFDEGQNEILEFRKNRHPLPWANIWIKDAFQHEWVKKLQLTSIPAPFLINPEGIIIADGMELRGETLERTLAKYLNQ